MDFAAEPVMDAFATPPRSNTRASARGETGPTFDEHLETVSPASKDETSQPAQPSEPKAQTSVDAQSAPPTEPAETANAVQAAIAVFPLPPSPVTAPIVLQLTVSSPQLQEAPLDAGATPLSTTPPIQPAHKLAAGDADAEAIVPAPANNTAEPIKSAPTLAPLQTATQTNAAPSTAPADAPTQQQPALQAAIAAELVSPVVQQAIVAPFAPSPEAIQQQSAPRVAKANVDAAQPRQATEAIETRSAGQIRPTFVGKTATNKISGAQGAMNEIASPIPAQAATTDGAQSVQSATTATATMQASVQAQYAAADAGAQRAAPAGAQVAREIIRRFDGGATTFELRLDPPELGRVEVRMEVSRDHRVTAVIVADNPQALTELARHARDLEQQLQSAGLQLSDNGLSFDLRQGAERGEAEKVRSAAGPNGGEDAASEPGQAPLARPIGFERWRGVRVDMMV